MANVTPSSSFSLFKGLCPVRIPFSWVADPDKVRWSAGKGIQYIDFTANGGPALAFSLSGTPSDGIVPEHWQSVVNPGCQEVDPHSIEWNGSKVYTEAYITMQVFGTSAQIIDLVPPAPDDGIKIYPPTAIAGVEVDATMPVRYYWHEDNFGGCGFFYAFVRTSDGGVLEASLGCEVEWQRPYLNGESTYEEYCLIRPYARKNPEKIWAKGKRELYAKEARFETDVFVA